MDFYQDKKIVFFDGVCNLCNGFVQFTIQRNNKEKLLFASLQSEAGLDMISHYKLDNTLSSVVFIDNGKLYQKSAAALRIANYLCCLWPMAVVLTIIPVFIRNGVYDLVARNRYKWFGKKDACMMPDPSLKNRFL